MSVVLTIGTVARARGPHIAEKSAAHGPFLLGLAGSRILLRSPGSTGGQEERTDDPFPTGSLVPRSRITCHDDVPQDRLIHAVLELSVGSRVTDLETRLGEDRHDLFAGGHQGVPGNTQGTAGA